MTVKYKKEVFKINLSIDKLTEKLNESINLDNYYSEETDCYRWKIKLNLLEENFADFLEKQFQLYNNEQTQAMQSALSRVKAAKNGEELIALAINNGFEHFQSVDYITEYERIKRDDGFEVTISVDYQLLAYFMDGKIIMECYGNILSYFEKNIRTQKIKYPVSECVKVMISG